jgi:hypothetical protein
MGTAKRQMAKSETGMLQTREDSEWGGGYRMMERQMARSETGMLQTCEGSEQGDGYSEEADGEV